MEKNKFLIIALAVFLIVASIFFIFNRAVSPKARVAFVIDDCIDYGLYNSAAMSTLMITPTV